jgi:hypothetical protein
MMDESRQKILSDRSYHTLPPPEPPAIPITVTSFVILGVMYYYGLAFEGGVLCDAEESLACKFTVSLIFTLMEEKALHSSVSLVSPVSLFCPYVTSSLENVNGQSIIQTDTYPDASQVRMQNCCGLQINHSHHASITRFHIDSNHLASLVVNTIVPDNTSRNT